MVEKLEPEDAICDCGENAIVVAEDGALYCYDCAMKRDYCPHCGEQF